LGSDNLYVKLSNTGNVVVNSNDDAGNSAMWTFDTTGNLNVPGNIVGPASANLTIYANAGVHEFTFGDDGTFYAPDNVVLGGTSVTIGPGANSLTGFGNAVLVASSNSEAYVQAVINNVSDVGSADWVAYGHHGTDAGGWADVGFTSSGFNDANYTITKPGSGYVFAHGFDFATQPVVAGDGSLVLATGEQGNVKDIIFGTGGFLEANEFGRISNSNNALELTRANSSIAFKGGTDGNINSVGNIKVISNSNTWTFDTTGTLTTPGNINLGNAALQSFGANYVLTANSQNYDTAVSMTDGGGVNLISANVGVQVTSGTDVWVFNTDGSISFPDSSVQTTAYTGGFGGNTDWANIGNINNANGPTKIAIGQNAGSNTQGGSAVALGGSAGENSQGVYSVAIGYAAAQINQGASAVAIGLYAGQTNQGNNSIVLNATGAALNQTVANTFTVAPVRNDTSNIAQVMFYNTTSKEVTYGNTISVAGNVTANYFIGNGSQLTGIPTQTTGNWTLAPGVNTVSITVPINGTYSIWVNGNIPNGIITYTATAVVTNNNVPVLGSSYGWYYAAGNALVLTSIPTQFVGTVNNISNAVVSTTTANVFTFGITNNSGTSQVVNWGYTKL
jgi:hypothetical protein